MIQPESWKTVGDYASRSWAAIGPLIGVLVGAYLTGQRQRRDWLADNKKEEYRELLSAITEALSTYTQLYVVQTVIDGNDQRRLVAATSEVVEVTRSRLFIAKQTKQLDILKRWFDLTHAFENTRDSGAFGEGTKKLLDEIVEAALRDVSR